MNRLVPEMAVALGKKEFFPITRWWFGCYFHRGGSLDRCLEAKVLLSAELKLFAGAALDRGKVRNFFAADRFAALAGTERVMPGNSSPPGSKNGEDR